MPHFGTRAALCWAVAVAACAAESPTGDRSRTVAGEEVSEVKRSYFAVLRGEVCAGRASDGAAVAVQLDRLRDLTSSARANGLEPILRETKAEWDRFATLAEWDCGEGDSAANLNAAVDEFADAVAAAVGRR